MKNLIDTVFSRRGQGCQTIIVCQMGCAPHSTFKLSWGRKLL